MNSSSGHRRRAGVSGLGITNPGLTMASYFLRGGAHCSRRSGSAMRVWPINSLHIAHPSLGYAALVNASRFGTANGQGIWGKGGGGGGGDDKNDDAVSKLIDKYGDGMGQATFSGLLGFSSGYAMMKVGKAVAFLIGVVFITAQGLNHAGVVSVKWNRLEDKAKKYLDTNNDSKLDKEDAKNLWKRLKNILTQNLPAGGGFAGGFALGLYCG